MTGVEWLVEAFDCDPVALRDQGRLEELLAAMSLDLPLHPVRPALWHRFPGEGGITGLCLLAESHFACHTFPEHRSMTINLFCCKPRPEWDFQDQLSRRFEAGLVTVRRLERDYAMAGALA